MSTLASTTILRAADLNGLAQTAQSKGRSWFGLGRDSYQAFLEKNGRPLGDYPASGYVVATLLSYLEEMRRHDLMHSAHDALAALLSETRRVGHFFLTEEHRPRIQELSADRFAEAELRDYYNEFNEAHEEEAGRAMLQALSFLRQGLGAIDADHVVLLRIG
jgi:hypothetical protein